jgi:outer membrane protein OmpA-like peptidoglycan-associated protein/tetratricopeptide (TPR) repeat protein
MIKFLLLNIFTLTLVSTAFSQGLEDDESCLLPDKKVMKIMKITTSPKASEREKSIAYSDAIQADPENAYTRFMQAEYNFKRGKRMEKSYNEGRITLSKLKTVYMGAMKGYKNTLDICDDYHASAFYKIGLIYYMFDDKENAVIYWKQFLAYTHSDPDKYPNEYAKWKSEVENLIPKFEGKKKAKEEFFANVVPYEPHLVNGVSTNADEFLPMISPDNELIFYTRRMDEKNLGDIQVQLKERFSASERASANSTFNTGNKLGAPFNSEAFVDFGGVTLSLDNKEMFICGCKMTEVYGQQYKNCDIYVTYFERSGEGGNDYSWSDLKVLSPAINTNDGWEAQPTLSADGNTLYFSANRRTTQNTDIFYSKRKANGQWGMAKPVPGINTEGHDKTPFLHQDSETMYFASQTSSKRKGAPELGNFDMFYTRMQKDGSWSEPKNLGNPINTENNEVGFVVSTDGHLAYFTSTGGKESAGGLDIYYFELYEEARPKKVMMIKGEAVDDEGEPIKDAKVEISYKNSGKSVEVKINGDDGKFAAIVEVDEVQDVMVTVKKEGHSFDTKLIKAEVIEKMITEEVTYVEEEIEMEIGKIEIGKSFTIDNILFATNSYQLNSDSKFILDQFIKFLKVNNGVKVTIEGHTDDLGNDAENLTLSQKRANASLNYIVSKEIDKSRLRAKGYGETKPKVQNSNSANRAKNRRTDFMITGM